LDGFPGRVEYHVLARLKSYRFEKKVEKMGIDLQVKMSSSEKRERNVGENYEFCRKTNPTENDGDFSTTLIFCCIFIN
jgi:hypothetical protein